MKPGDRTRSVLRRLLELGLVLTAVVSFATVVDEWHRALELLSHFRLQYFGAAAVLTLAFLWLRQAGYVTLGLATLAVNAWYVLPWYLPAPHDEPADRDLVLLDANVLRTNADTRRFLALVADVEPDIITLQEVTPAWVDGLDSLRETYGYRVVETRDDPFGIAVYSRLPLESSAVNYAAPRGYPEIVATVSTGARPLRIIVAHTANPVSPGGYGARNLQLAALAKLASRTPSPVLIVGDLNISVWAHHYRSLLRDSGLRSARTGFGVVPTWPVWLPPARIPIDHVLVSDDIEVTSFAAGPRIGSDHLPLVVHLRLTE